MHNVGFFALNGVERDLRLLRQEGHLDLLHAYEFRDIALHVPHARGTRHARNPDSSTQHLRVEDRRKFEACVGVLANGGVLDTKASQKGAHFVELCAQRGVPVLFLQNITGFSVGSVAERAGIARDGAKLVAAVSCANVPKITLIVGGSHGAGNYGMCGRAFDPDFLFAYPNSRIGVMGAAQAADTLLTVKQAALKSAGEPPLDDDAALAFKQPVQDSFEAQASPYYATARLWDDGVIDPKDTRVVLARALHAVKNKPRGTLGRGVFRM